MTRVMAMRAKGRGVRKLDMVGVLLAIAGSAAGCGPEQERAPVDRGDTLSVSVSEERIQSQEGDLLISLDQIPRSIQVDEDSDFQAADRFLAADASPSGEWLAVITGGVAHSAGWLVDIEGEQIFPAGFQYGGSLQPGPWSPDGRWFVFIHEGPAGDRVLWVTDSDALGSTVRESSTPVRTPDHDETDPSQRIYEIEGWEDGTLQIRLKDEPWSFDPRTGDMERR